MLEYVPGALPRASATARVLDAVFPIYSPSEEGIDTPSSARALLPTGQRKARKCKDVTCADAPANGAALESEPSRVRSNTLARVPIHVYTCLHMPMDSLGNHNVEVMVLG